MTESSKDPPQEERAADTGAPRPRTLWRKIWDSLGIKSVVAAAGAVTAFLAAWDNTCVRFELCRFPATVSAAVSSPRETRSAAVRALLPRTVRSHKNAVTAYTLLSANLRTFHKRAAGAACPSVSSGASIADDVQAVVEVLAAAAVRADTVLRLDSLNLPAVSLKSRSMGHATFQGSCLVEATFDSITMRGGNFKGAHLVSSHWRGAKADSSDFSGARLDSASFDDARLIGSDFSEDTAIGARFVEADLRCALLGNAVLSRANFSRADMRWAYLGGADLRTAENLLQVRSWRSAALDGVIGLLPSVARALRDSGAVFDDQRFAELRMTQFAQDAVCWIPKS